MNLRDIEDFRLGDAVKFHDTLNPALFSDDKLNPDVRKRMLEIAQDFVDHLGIDDIKIKDITLSGSNAAFTYTPHSDVDIHLIVDMDQFNNDEVYRELFNSKKVLYNDSHDIKIHGYDVELYVQDAAEPVKSLGEYSIKNDRWIKYPGKTRANLDQRAVKEKFAKLVQLSQLAMSSDQYENVDNLLDTLKRYRKAGLDEHGEFGPENLAYKALRSQGIIQQLYDRRDQIHSRQLSLQENEYEYMPPGAPDEDVERILRKMAQQKAKYKTAAGGGKIIYKRPADITGSSITDAEMIKMGFKWDNLYNKWRGTQKQWDRLYKERGIRESSGPLDRPTLTPQQIMRKHGISYEQLIDQLTQGIKVELEHTSDSAVAYQIALAHMAEDPDYYTKLAKVGLEEGISQTTLNQLYDEMPDRDEMIWNFVGQSDFDTPFTVETINPNKLKLYFLSQYRVEHIDEITDLMDTEQRKIVNRYIKDPQLSNKTIVMADGKVIDGQHRAMAAILSNRPIKYIDVAEETLNEGASGYIPSKKQANDPRFKTALTVDVKPDSIKKNAKKLGLGSIHRSGIPQTARSDGKFR